MFLLVVEFFGEGEVGADGIGDMVDDIGVGGEGAVGGGVALGGEGEGAGAAVVVGAEDEDDIGLGDGGGGAGPGLGIDGAATLVVYVGRDDTATSPRLPAG